jgi:hypothetical protein
VKLKATTLGVVALSGSIAFLCLSGVSAQVPTQPSVVNHRYVSPSVGVTLSQALQVNVVNDSAATVDPRQSMLVVQARLVDKNGVVVAGSDRQTLARGATFSWRISRDELSSMPVDELGRVQTRVEVTIRGVANSGAFVASLEVVNPTTGATESGMIGDIRTVISAEG